MRLSALTLVAALVLVGPAARGAELEPLTDAPTAHLLNALEILEESDGPGQLALRIMRVNDAGECVAGQEARTCPRGRLLVGVSLDDKGPRSPMVWRTERHIGWRFVRWLPAATDTTGAALTLFEVKDCEAADAVESGRREPKPGAAWREVHWEIGINLKHATIRRLLPADAPVDCDLG